MGEGRRRGLEEGFLVFGEIEVRAGERFFSLGRFLLWVVSDFLGFCLSVFIRIDRVLGILWFYLVFR